MKLRFLGDVRRLRNSRVGKTRRSTVLHTEFSMRLWEQLPIRFGNGVRRAPANGRKMEQDIHPSSHRVCTCKTAPPCGLIAVRVRTEATLTFVRVDRRSFTRRIRYNLLIYLRIPSIRLLGLYARRPIVSALRRQNVYQRRFQLIGTRFVRFANRVRRIRLVRCALYVITYRRFPISFTRTLPLYVRRARINLY